ncbi:MAG: hypothetical protein VYD19_02230 [Myxococcota bacterium]|nr:hypothetical protein [Myxococcota bacterium]
MSGAELNVPDLFSPDGDEVVLCCFDFDLTLTTIHLHNQLAQLATLGIQRETLLERGERWIEAGGLREENKLWPLIVAILEAGHEVAIVTFSAFPELVRVALMRGSRILRQRDIGSTVRRRFAKIPIYFGGPAPSLSPTHPPPHCFEVTGDHWQTGKGIYIERAIADREAESKTRLRPLLIDDDEDNLDAARALKIEGLFAPAPPEPASHFDRLRIRLNL